MSSIHARLAVSFGLVAFASIGNSGCTLLFPTEAGDDLAHFADQAPQTGDTVPDFELSTIDGGTVRLHNLLGREPIVLQVGSHSCPVYRYRSYEVHDLYEEFYDTVQFVILYTQEAHPAGSPSPYREGEEWLTNFNRFTGNKIPQPGSLEERIEQAAWSTERLSLTGTVAVDNMDNRTWEVFGSAPSPAYVIDSDGTVILRQPWVNPSEIRDTLRELLAPSGADSATTR
ncbi:MAG: deiodinase-like protein [Pseudomonadota bacterium]